MVFVNGAIIDPEGTDGHAAAHTFGPRNAVGLNVGGTEGTPAHHFTKAAEAALHLIEQKQKVGAPTEASNAFEKFWSSRIDAAFALDGFEENGTGSRANRFGEALDLVKGDVLEAG